MAGNAIKGAAEAARKKWDDEERPARASFVYRPCLLYTSDAADERSSVDLGGSRVIKKKKVGIIAQEIATPTPTDEVLNNRDYRSQNNTTRNYVGR